MTVKQVCFYVWIYSISGTYWAVVYLTPQMLEVMILVTGSEGSEAFLSPREVTASRPQK